MQDLICYKTLNEWDASTLPDAFRHRHNTKVGTWAKLTILEGELAYDALDEAGNSLETFVFTPENQPPLIEPQAWHKVTPLTPTMRCQLAFYCQRKDYYHKKYQLSRTHSEVLATMAYIQAGEALDLGCGQGRNALYLQQMGFQVTATDVNTTAVAKLNDIITAEKLAHIKAYVADANLADIQGEYDLIVSTVVLMFLKRKCQPAVIANMQAHTRPGGYNVLVCALDTPDYPCAPYDLPFESPMLTGEVENYYRHWHLKKCNENVGNLYRQDKYGNNIMLRFATLIAQKPLLAG